MFLLISNILTYTWFCVAGVFIIRAIVVLYNHEVIADAILAHQFICIKHLVDEQVDLDDMEEIEDTFKRLWDWGYKNILPKDKYEIIKEYIK